MNQKEKIHKLLNEAAMELLAFIKDSESKLKDQDRWVPAAEIKSKLDLNFVTVPRSGKQYGEKGWVFAALARLLEDKSLLEYKKLGSRAFYRSTRK